MKNWDEIEEVFKFMDWEYSDSNYFDLHDWNPLMTVYIKINEVFDNLDLTNVHPSHVFMGDELLDGNLEGVFEHAVSCIKWYNKNYKLEQSINNQ